MKYKAVYEHGADGWWTVTIPQVAGCHSQGRTIEQARERVREALALAVGNKEVKNAEFVDSFRLARGVMRDVRVVHELRAELERVRQRLAATERRAVKRLRADVHLGQRDTGQILGVSFQRIHQLEQSTE